MRGRRAQPLEAEVRLRDNGAAVSGSDLYVAAITTELSSPLPVAESSLDSPGVALADVRQRARTGAEGQLQLHADDIVAVMRRKPPRDAFAQVAVTMEDLVDVRRPGGVEGVAPAERECFAGGGVGVKF